jgi:hypothetical protein
VLIDRATLEGIAAGEISCAFRRWKRPTVKAGGTLKTAAGLLAIEAVEPVTLKSLTDADARSAGFASRAQLVAALRRREAGRFYRIRLRLAGPDPRIALRHRAELDDDELAAIAARLAAFDRASRRGPWTAETLAAIAENPGVRALDLATGLGREKKWFKANVRKLKELGLTESLETGYRLSPRGRAVIGSTIPERRAGSGRAPRR